MLFGKGSRAGPACWAAAVATMEAARTARKIGILTRLDDAPLPFGLGGQM